ncbi:hypothetical protein [Hydrogenophaga defluvii]|uniref:Outer membrane lipoprotein n=1 Tax=Hydrogenophaga defluvii TaxID=249410 RepID=A0ABW2SH30_9BURK
MCWGMKVNMRLLSLYRSSIPRAVSALGLVSITVALTGCYVVPIDTRTGQPASLPSSAPAAAPAPAVPLIFPARLYPANELASGYGLVHATVSNDLKGRGTFNAAIAGESFVGEATRRTGSNRDGVANGAGNRGAYLSCQYTMNSATQGTGTCRLNNGAEFTMHVGN